MSTGPSDIEIISAVLNGNQQAYAVIVQRHQTFVFTLVLRYIKNREDAEEVAQDVFVKAYKALADFKGASKFSTWLYTITNTTMPITAGCNLKPSSINWLKTNKQSNVYSTIVLFVGAKTYIIISNYLLHTSSL